MAGAVGTAGWGVLDLRGKGEKGATPRAQDIVRTLECVIFVMNQSPFCHHDHILSDWQLLDIWMGLMLDPAKAVAFYAISSLFFLNNIPNIKGALWMIEQDRPFS